MSFFQKTSNPILAWVNSIVAWTMAACILLPAQAPAQQIEEVVIGAERSENAPIDDLSSASVLDGEKLADAGIENIEDVAAYVPNLVLTETSTGTNIVIRGIGAGVNQGFDQSVGLYADGVPLPRSQMARAPFLDLAGVQVLRGPQYVKDGNYSIAGSVHMVSRAAADEFEFDINSTYIPSQNEKKLLLTLGTPITEKLGLRLALERKTSDGYIENVARSEDGPQTDNLFIRSVFNYEATDNLSIKLKYERGRFDTKGRQIELLESQDTPDFRTFYDGGATPSGVTPQGLDPADFAREPTLFRPPPFFQSLPAYTTETDFLYNGTFYDLGFSEAPGAFVPNGPAPDPAFAGRSYVQVLHDLYTGRVPLRPDGTPSQSAINEIPFSTASLRTTPPPGLLDTSVDFRRAANEDEFSENDSENITLNLDYRLGDHTFKFVASYVDYEVDERIDTDFTPVPILVTDQTEEYEQTFFRFDYESPEDQFIEFAFGASYLDSELSFDEVISDGVGGPTTQEEAAEFLFNATQLNTAASQTDFIQFDPDRPFLSYFGRTSIPAVQALQFFEIDRQFDQSAETTAAFFDVTFNISDRFRAIVGARYTRSEKAAVRDLAYLLRSGEPFTDIALLDAFPFDSADSQRSSFNNLVNQLGFIFNFQLHTDRIPQIQDADTPGINFFGSPAISSIPANTVSGCEGQVSFALGGDCDPNGGRRREEKLLPSITFQYEVTPDLSTYFSVKTANKLGGFDARSVSTPAGSSNFGVDPGTFEFEDEDAITFELGANWFLPAGFGELRAAAFYTDFENLQVSAADRSVGQNVRNAASAETYGIELEGLLQLSETFNVVYALAWTEFKFGDYPVAACALEERADGILITQPNSLYGEVGEVVPILYEETNLLNFNEASRVGTAAAPTGSDPNQFILFRDTNGDEAVFDTGNPGGAAPPNSDDILFSFGALNTFSGATELGARVCNFEGRTNQYVADYQATVTFNYQKALPHLNLIFKPTLDVLYNSGYETSVRQDSDVAQREYTQFNGRLAIASLEDAWELAVVGENLTNEKIVSFASEVPIATRIQGSKTHFGFIRPPRSIGINFRYKFY